ncbi:MAG: transposon-encoded TnpW family protein [Blautia sp.]
MTQTATKTTYELSLHFSQTGTERMSDKVMRLLENFSLCP